MGWEPIRDDALSVRHFGVRGDGTTNDQAALTSAITTAIALGKPLAVPPGTYGLSTPLSPKDGLRIIGPGRHRATFKALSGFSGAALLLGSSGDTVSDVVISDLGFDGNFATTAAATHGIQITNGSRPQIHRCLFTNFGGSAVLVQGLSGGGTPDAEIHDCVIDGAGLSNGTTGHAIHVKDASHRASVQRNNLSNVKGGMGIAIGTSGVTPSPTDCRVIGNVIRMVTSTTGFEAIGVGDKSDRVIVANNSIFDSWDNGISASGQYAVVTGNNIDGALNHGIAGRGHYNTITGNTIRNVGRESTISGRAGFGEAYGGISLDSGKYCLIAGNTIGDDQTSPTTAYAIKLNSSEGQNRVGPNAMQGYTVAAFFGIGSFDIIHGLNDVFVTQTLTSNGAVTINAWEGGVQRVNLQANATSCTIVGGYIGQRLIITWNQDVVGGRSYVWPGTCLFAGGTAPTATTTAFKRDRVEFTYDGVVWAEIARAMNV